MSSSSDDETATQLVSVLEHGPSRAAVTAERSFMSAIEAGCHMPVGAIGKVSGSVISLLGMVAIPGGEQLLRLSVEGAVEDPRGVGERLAAVIRRGGGDKILAVLRGDTTEEEGVR